MLSFSSLFKLRVVDLYHHSGLSRQTALLDKYHPISPYFFEEVYMSALAIDLHEDVSAARDGILKFAEQEILPRHAEYQTFF